MAEFVATRTSLQCRSHHQKFLEKLGDIKSIVYNLKKYINKDDLQRKNMELQGKKSTTSEKIKIESHS